jgi:hypothetical protein
LNNKSKAHIVKTQRDQEGEISSIYTLSEFQKIAWQDCVDVEILDSLKILTKNS